MTGELLGKPTDGEGQNSPEQRLGGWEWIAGPSRRDPHGHAALLGQLHRGPERAGFVDFRADDEDWVPPCGETRCQALYDRGRHPTDRGDVACHQEVG